MTLISLLWTCYLSTQKTVALILVLLEMLLAKPQLLPPSKSQVRKKIHPCFAAFVFSSVVCI